MPVTTRAAPIEVKQAPESAPRTAADLLRSACKGIVEKDDELWLSAFDDGTLIHPARQGFVGTVLHAYLQHNHLVLRPEDIWFSILVQFSFYVSNHAEELRRHFVDHAGKKKLEIVQDHFDFRDFCVQMTELIAENVKDPALRDWIMPAFSTTMDGDKVTAAIIMMGTMQKYFVDFCTITCGIPSVTLLGERSDWQDILDRLPFLSKFGAEHEELLLWNSVLTAVVSKFVDTFDAPDSPDVVHFWQRSVHRYSDDYFGQKRITGWIQAFCFWRDTGYPLVAENVLRTTRDWRGEVAENGLDYWLDGVRLGQTNWDDVPSGYAHVPVHIKFKTYPPAKFLTRAIAGSIGWRVVDSEAVFKQTRGPKNPRPNRASKERDDEHSAGGNLDAARTARTQPSLQKRNADYDENWAKWTLKKTAKHAPQISDLSELDQPWEYETGGEHDAIQPVTGWWLVETKDGEYGKDPDCPDVQFDSDAEDYDYDLARNGRPLALEE